MVQIVLTPEQARVLATATNSIEIVDAQGNRLGFFARPFSNQDVENARKRADSDEPRRKTEQVLEHLQSLELK